MHVLAEEVTRVVVAKECGAGGVGEGAVPCPVDAIDPLAARLQEEPHLFLALPQLRLAPQNPANGKRRPATDEHTGHQQEERHRDNFVDPGNVLQFSLEAVEPQGDA